MVSENQINKNSGKEILAKIYTTDEDPIELVDKMGLKSMDNKDELVNMVNEVLSYRNYVDEHINKLLSLRLNKILRYSVAFLQSCFNLYNSII